MTLREEFENEMKEQSKSMLDFFFLTSVTNYVNWLEARQNKRTEEVFLATVNSWDGTSIIGVYSTKDKALSESIAYLLKASNSMNKDEIYTPINEVINEDCSAWDITNSDDVLVLRVMEVDATPKDTTTENARIWQDETGHDIEEVKKNYPLGYKVTIDGSKKQGMYWHVKGEHTIIGYTTNHDNETLLMLDCNIPNEDGETDPDHADNSILPNLTTLVSNK